MTIEPRDLAERFGLGLRQQVIAAERISLTIGTGEFLSLVTGGRSPERPRGTARHWDRCWVKLRTGMGPSLTRRSCR
jgi:hypothetical protein